MKSTYLLFSTAVMSLALLSLGHSVQAGFFYAETLIGDPTSLRYEDDPWIYFNGCENANNTACVVEDSEDDLIDDTLLIGDYDVKQGLYIVTEPSDAHFHGKLILTYSYRFLTEEVNDNMTDVGYVKVKDVATNAIYYLASYTAEDQTEDWKKVRIALPTDLVNRQIQVVVEVVNDDARLSTMGIHNITLTHGSEPVIRGTVYEKVAGKKVPISGVTIQLQNRSRTKTYAETTTVVQSDTPDTYTFWPVERRKKFTITANYQGEEKTLNVSKLMWGSFKADEDFYF